MSDDQNEARRPKRHRLLFHCFWTLLLGVLPLHPCSISTALGQQSHESKQESKQESKPESSLIQEQVVEGLLIQLKIEPLAGATELRQGVDAKVTYTIRDANSGEPLTGLHPLSWMHGRDGLFPPNKVQLKEMVSQFLGGLISISADHDLNKYYLLVLNGDRSISIIDPLVAFSITKLRNLIGIPGDPVDWALDEIHEKLLVTLPDEGQLLVIDLTRAQIEKVIDFGEGTEPVKVLIQEDHNTAWISLDGTDQLAPIDLISLEAGPRISLGKGRHVTAVDADSNWLAATNTEDGTVTIVDLNDRSRVRTIEVGETPLALQYAPLAARFLIACANENRLRVVDPIRAQVTRSLEIPRGVIDVSVDPTGRFAFLASPSAGEVAILDTATNQLVHSITTALAPDRVICTSSFAYIHDTQRANIILVDLNRLSHGKLVVTELGIGRNSMDSTSVGRQITSLLAPTPEGNAMFVGNSADKLVYYYVEGMMASMGNFQTYKRIPRGVLVMDRSLQESGPGEYSTYVRFDRPGILDVPFLLDQPRALLGFEVEVKRDELIPVAEALTPVVVKFLQPEKKIHAGDQVPLRVMVSDSETGDPISDLADVQLMLFPLDGSFQERLAAKPVGDGIYQCVGSFPEQLRFGVLVQVESRGLTFGTSPLFEIPVYPEAN
ncbi:MAG: hypothetical protein OSB09_11395 [Planctomycetota bacterium]|nr:hypothetical protein [Planctomycetota bacterium]